MLNKFGYPLERKREREGGGGEENGEERIDLRGKLR